MPLTVSGSIMPVARGRPAVAAVATTGATASVVQATAAQRRMAGHDTAGRPARGGAWARNLGARATVLEVAAFLDDDAVPEPQWLAELLAEFADPDVAAVTGRILELEAGALDAGRTRDEQRARAIFGGAERLVL